MKPDSKLRVIDSLAHKQPDKIPVDLGSTAVTGIHILAIEKLRNYYGLNKHPVRLIEPYQMLGEIEDDLAEILHIDTYGLYPPNTLFGFPNENWKELRTFWGQEILVPGKFNTVIDKNGDLLIFPEGDLNSPPSGKMPKSGYFFDTIVRQEPVIEDKLNPEDNLEEFNLISENELQYWSDQIKTAKASGKGIIANFGGTAIGDIALVPAPFIKNPKGIRDISEWYMSTLIRTDYIKYIFEKQTDIAIKNLEKIFAVVGNDVDAVFICGTDFGTQDSSFCSPLTFNELYLPYYQKINNWIHKNTAWKTFKHSCGAVEPFMECFINAGFDIINPVQISAANMDPKYLKEKYGNRLTFWGGGVDTQNILPFGSPAEVEKQVLEVCEIFSKNGGYIFNTIHNIQANVSVENIVAIFAALNKFNGY